MTAEVLITLICGPEVCRCIGRSLSTLWVWVRRGDFPQPLVLNPGQGREVVA
jgi:predicted DNA-binding transcriptional regulator AlpA